jgi:Lrp/AsnC family transcriptional regulator for asnA, asnC and gidA
MTILSDGQTDLGKQVKIDQVDVKIIQTLLLESRTSFTDLALSCGITVTAVRMRYKRLWKEGVINGEKILVNPHNLGYHHIVDLLITSSFEEEKAVTQFLENKAYISELVGPFGNYSYLGKVALRDLKKLHGIIEDFEANPHIKRVDTLIWANAANVEYPQNLVINPFDYESDLKDKRKIENYPTDSELKRVELDDLDKKVAKILSENSRTPFIEIAKELDLSSKTVIQRYNKLRKTLFTLSTITLDLSKLGYKALANMYLKISNRSKINEIYKKLLEIPNIIVIIRLIGSYDLYVALVLEDFQPLFEANEKIRTINGVESNTTYLTQLPNSWPLHLFLSLIDNEQMLPKFWH